jgi:hypothetical protein
MVPEVTVALRQRNTRDQNRHVTLLPAILT